MADMLHGNARSMPRVRAGFQGAQRDAGNRSRRHGLSRTSRTTACAPMGPAIPREYETHAGRGGDDCIGNGYGFRPMMSSVA